MQQPYSQAFTVYEMEVSFYAYIQEYFPRCRQNIMQARTANMVEGCLSILMQDLNSLTECEFIREQDSCGLSHALAVVSGLARFHSIFNSPPTLSCLK